MLDFQPIDLRNASETEYQCLSEFKNQINYEYLPDDPPTPLEEHKQNWKNIPAFVENETYIIWDSSTTKIIAFSEIEVQNTGDNEHTVFFTIEVLPEFRRQGIGRQALNTLLPFAQKHKRTLWLTFITDRISESTHFMERLGARAGLKMHTNQLKLADFDTDLVKQWSEHSKHLHTDFDIRLWIEAYPDEYLVEVAALMQELANDQPRDNLELEDWNVTPEILRQMEKNMFARGDQRWTMYIVDRAIGNITGLTEVFWNPNRPMILNQGFTAVLPAYRNKGLGRWLKAEMMQKILSERPEVQFIRTGNANSNAPMLKINIAMGFKPYIAKTLWQVETDKIEAYLSKEHS